MATANPERPAAAFRTDAGIHHPLDRLRGTIRRYVVVEGLLLAGIFVVVWFAAALLLDYGLFKVATFDWALETPRWFRGVALAGMALLLLGLLVTRVVLRLRREFSYPSLALVLERRFPNELGDRLITAVELADVGAQSRYGYSEGMIRQTVEEARERVARVPVADAFNWRRLWTLGGVLVGLAAAIVVVSYGLFALTTGTASPVAFGWRAYHTTAILAERDVALINTPWPRRAHVELVGFPGDELRIGKDAAAPKVRARAFQWVVADRNAREGWRPMTWADLKPVLGIAPPELPASAAAAADAAVALGDNPTLDHVEAVYLTTTDRRVKPEVAGEAASAVGRAFEALDAAAADPSRARTVRRLDRPDGVYLTYAGVKTSGGGTMTAEGEEFATEVAGLKESVVFSVRAADFLTRPRTITLVPPPMLSKLVRTEYQPAYLHHGPPTEGGFAALKGLRQRMPDKDVSLTGDRSVFSVPAGTEVVLTGTTDKPIRAAVARPKIGKLPPQATAAGEPLPVDADGAVALPIAKASGPGESDRFTLALRGDARPTANTEFELSFEDDDGVRSVRPVLVQVTEDRVPDVTVVADILREGKQGDKKVLLVTPAVRVPFAAGSVVRDDTALSRVEYRFAYSQVESEVVAGLQSQLVVRVLAGAPGPVGLPTGLMPAYTATVVRLVSKGDAKQTGTAMVGRFVEQVNNLRRETPAVLARRLAEPLPEGGPPDAVRQVEFKSADADYFDLKVALPDLQVGPGEVQPRYRVDLDVVATDANFETGPKVGQTSDPIRLLVVSEADLLAEISKEEEKLALKLDEAIKKLRDARGKLDQMVAQLGSPDVPTLTLAVRGQDVIQDVAKGRDLTQAVLVQYARILRECEVNVVARATQDRYRNTIVNPLGVVLDRDFPRSERAQAELQTPLTANRKPDEPVVAKSRQALDTLITNLQTIRNELGEAISIDKLRNDLRKILENQELVSKALVEGKRKVTDLLFAPDIRPLAGPVFLAKGETKAVKHAIDWKLWDKGDLGVRLTASDPELKVPGEVKVKEEAPDLEYEITAGQKAGDFSVTINPAAGKLIQVRVTVK